MSFASDVSKFAKLTGKSIDQTGASIALELFSSIIKDTPADTGRARGNWQCSLDAPITSQVNAGGAPGSESPAPDGDGSEAKKAIADVRNTAIKFIGGTTIYLTNNLPYIWSLEYGGYGRGDGATEKTGGTGFSIQAPAGMVRKNAARIQSIVAKAARENKV